jgi:hypothetical protein
MWHSLVESGVVDVDWLTLACRGPYFIPFPLCWVRANWRRSWSCGRWLATACVEVQQSSGELQCIKTACARHAASVDQGVCLSLWLWEVPTCLTQVLICGSPCLLCLLSNPDDRDSFFLQNIDELLWDYIASHPRRYHTSGLILDYQSLISERLLYSRHLLRTNLLVTPYYWEYIVNMLLIK